MLCWMKFDELLCLSSPRTPLELGQISWEISPDFNMNFCDPPLNSESMGQLVCTCKSARKKEQAQSRRASTRNHFCNCMAQWQWSVQRGTQIVTHKTPRLPRHARADVLNMCLQASLLVLLSVMLAGDARTLSEAWRGNAKEKRMDWVLYEMVQQNTGSSHWLY